MISAPSTLFFEFGWNWYDFFHKHLIEYASAAIQIQSLLCGAVFNYKFNFLNVYGPNQTFLFLLWQFW